MNAAATPAPMATTGRQRIRRAPSSSRIGPWTSRGSLDAWPEVSVGVRLATGARVRILVPAVWRECAYTAVPTVPISDPTKAPLIVPATPRKEAARAELTAASELPATWVKVRPRPLRGWGKIAVVTSSSRWPVVLVVVGSVRGLVCKGVWGDVISKVSVSGSGSWSGGRFRRSTPRIGEESGHNLNAGAAADLPRPAMLVPPCRTPSSPRPPTRG